MSTQYVEYRMPDGIFLVTAEDAAALDSDLKRYGKCFIHSQLQATNGPRSGQRVHPAMVYDPNSSRATTATED